MEAVQRLGDRRFPLSVPGAAPDPGRCSTWAAGGETWPPRGSAPAGRSWPSNPRPQAAATAHPPRRRDRRRDARQRRPAHAASSTRWSSATRWSTWPTLAPELRRVFARPAARRPAWRSSCPTGAPGSGGPSASTGSRSSYRATGPTSPRRDCGRRWPRRASGRSTVRPATPFITTAWSLQFRLFGRLLTDQGAALLAGYAACAPIALVSAVLDAARGGGDFLHAAASARRGEPACAAPSRPRRRDRRSRARRPGRCSCCRPRCSAARCSAPATTSFSGRRSPPRSRPAGSSRPTTSSPIRSRVHPRPAPDPLRSQPRRAARCGTPTPAAAGRCSPRRSTPRCSRSPGCRSCSRSGTRWPGSRPPSSCSPRSGAYLFARELALRADPSLLAGISFAFGMFFVVWLEHPQTNVWLCLPWMFLATRRVCARGSLGATALLGAGHRAGVARRAPGERRVPARRHRGLRRLRADRRALSRARPEAPPAQLDWPRAGPRRSALARGW